MSRTSRLSFAGMMLAAFAAGLGGLVTMAASASAKERFAIIVANKDYRYASEIQFAERDAQAIEELLTTVYEIPRRNIERVDNASLADLKVLFGGGNSLGRLTGLVRGKDAELFVYFVGHGSRETAQGSNQSIPYLMATDSEPSQLAVSGYSVDTLISQLERLKNEQMPEGKVTLVLESCFSGRSNAGDLVKNRSAPLHGAPVVLASRTALTSSSIRVLAAAQGDQFAVWDTGHRMSIFTDALVSGLFGEADEADFGGDGDGAITAGELERFLETRMSRRLKAVEPGAVQRAELVGAEPGEVLANPGGRLPWIIAEDRKHDERLRSALLLAEPDETKVSGYLESCLYCPNRTELQDRLRQDRLNARICARERETADVILSSRSAAAADAYLGSCTCCSKRSELEAMLKELEEAAKVAALPAASAPSQSSAPTAPSLGQAPTLPSVPGAPATAEPTVPATPTQKVASADPTQVENEQPALSSYQIITRLQQALIEKSCLSGRADGIWGRNSAGALERFAEYSNEALDDQEPSADLLEAIETSKVVCDTEPSVARRTSPQASEPRRAECAEGQKRNSRGKCYTPRSTRTVKTAPSEATPTRTRSTPSRTTTTRRTTTRTSSPKPKPVVRAAPKRTPTRSATRTGGRKPKSNCSEAITTSSPWPGC